MNTVVSGHFADGDAGQASVTALAIAGFSRSEIAERPVRTPDPMAVPAVEQPGHDPAVGGAVKGAGIGAAAGVVVGLATLPLLGPAAGVAGVGAGAYVGALVGALSRLGDPDHPDLRPLPEAAAEAGLAVDAGHLVAVQCVEPGRRDTAIRVLRERGAHSIRVFEGTIVDSQWTDYDPLRLPLPAMSP
jgi:hypothetical protein